MVRIMKKNSKINRTNKRMEEIEMLSIQDITSCLRDDTKKVAMQPCYVSTAHKNYSIQDKLYDVALDFWKKCGFDVSFVDKITKESVLMLISDKNVMDGLSKDLKNHDEFAVNAMLDLINIFSFIMTLSAQEICEFNSASASQKQVLFTVFLLTLAFHYQYMRNEFMERLKQAPVVFGGKKFACRLKLLHDMLLKIS